MAGRTGFEPAIFAVTGRRVKPLHYRPFLFLTLIFLQIQQSDEIPLGVSLQDLKEFCGQEQFSFL